MDSITNSISLLKIVLIGDAAVGKSSLLQRYVNQTFDQAYICTIGVDFKIKTVRINARSFKLQIWDTAGQERFKPITNCYFRGSHGCLAVFDLTNKCSFDNLETWVQSYRENSNWESELNIIIVGNKSDSKFRIVKRDQAEILAERLGCLYYQTSAKTGENLQQVFIEITKKITDKIIPEKQRNFGVEVKRDRGIVLKEDFKDVSKKTISCCYVL